MGCIDMTIALFDRLLAEYDRATKKHNWDGYGYEEMDAAFNGEVEEIFTARERADVHGPHGEIAESIQGAVVLLRRAEHLARLFPVSEVERG